jgi:hypothetical protein
MPINAEDLRERVYMHMRLRKYLPASVLAAGLLGLALNGAPGALAASGGHGHLFHGTRSKLTAAQVRRLSAKATDRSIIIYKNQLTNLPAKGRTASQRIKAANSAQAGVLSVLRQLHATHVRSFHIINAIAATV